MTQSSVSPSFCSIVIAMLSSLSSVLLPVCATAEGIVEIVPQVASISGVRTVALSPDGTLVVSGDFQGAVTLWSVASRRILRQFGGHAGGVNSVAFAPDGESVLTAGVSDINTCESELAA